MDAVYFVRLMAAETDSSEFASVSSSLAMKLEKLQSKTTMLVLEYTKYLSFERC